MIDTAKSGYQGGKSQADIIVIKYLKDIGIKEIENIIITHFDSDHCNGLIEVIEKLNVKNIIISRNHDYPQKPQKGDSQFRKKSQICYNTRP